MITITILTKEEVHFEDIPDAWSCWLELTDGQETLYLPATAPVDTENLLAHFQAQADRLWDTAQRKGYTNPLSILPERTLLKAIAHAANLSDTDITQSLLSVSP